MWPYRGNSCMYDPVLANSKKKSIAEGKMRQSKPFCIQTWDERTLENFAIQVAWYDHSVFINPSSSLADTHNEV